jgi:hypothetical protein
MRTRGVLLFVTALVLAAPAAASVPGSSYHWAQPPASVPIAVSPAHVALPGSSYPWAQPDAVRPAGAPSVQPPAGIVP